jgi:hypothetical protein
LLGFARPPRATDSWVRWSTRYTEYGLSVSQQGNMAMIIKLERHAHSCRQQIAISLANQVITAIVILHLLEW